MGIFFTLILLAALVGVVRPYINGLNRKHFGVAALGAFIVTIATAETPQPGGAESKATAPEVASTPAASGTPGSKTGPSPATAPGKWDYSEDKDEMRGTVTKFARLRSANEVDMDFPYGVVGGELLIRKRPEDGLNVMFQVDKGQVLCHSFSDGHVSIKFDDGPIQKFSCSGSSDGSSETAFIDSESRAVAALKKSKRAIVEAEFYQRGRQQFTFETAGLKWD